MRPHLQLRSSSQWERAKNYTKENVNVFIQYQRSYYISEKELDQTYSYQSRFSLPEYNKLPIKIGTNYDAFYVI